jgi:hypothetical protein
VKPLILVEMMFSACRMAHSFEQQATLRSMVSRTSEVTLAPPVLLVHFQTKTHQ